MLDKATPSSGFAYLLKKFPRLSETFILNEILGQEALGRSIHIFSRREPDDEPHHPELRGLRASVEVFPAPRELDPWELVFVESGSRSIDVAQLERVVRVARTFNHPRLPSLITEALYFLERTQKLGIRHVHTHFATDSALVAMLAHDLGGPTYSLTAHAKDIYRANVNRELLRRLLARAEFSVTVCDANRDFLIRTFEIPDTTRLRRLYNGITLSSFSASSDTPRDPDHVLAVGRLVEKKGFDILLKALARLNQMGHPFTATIVGDGDERASLDRMVTELGLSKKVCLTGALDLGEVRKLMGRATVFCLPCVVGQDGNRDALPTVLIECLASGVPIISTPVSGVPEILDGGKAGVLVPAGDVAQTALAIQELLQNPERRKSLAEAGAARAAELFDLERSAEVLGLWFDEILQPKVALTP